MKSTESKIRVIIEAPFKGNGGNLDFGRECLKDSLLLGEAPIWSPQLYDHPLILSDRVKEERQMGMEAGWSWIFIADKMVVYTDYGISDGMQAGIQIAIENNIPIEYRRLYR